MQSTETNPRTLYDRTECACRKCTLPCLHMPGALIPEDLMPMMEACLPGRDAWRVNNDWTAMECWAATYLQASEGGKVLVRGNIIKIPTIVPRAGLAGCMFLDLDNRCSLHEVSPFGCSHFSVCTDSPTWQRRSMAYQQRVLWEWENNPDGLYVQLWLFLEEIGNVAEPTADRRGRFSAALKQIERKKLRRQRK